jgi:hypothetical protein
VNEVLGILCAAALFAAYTLLGRRVTREHGAGRAGGGCAPGSCDACASRSSCTESDDDAR